MKRLPKVIEINKHTKLVQEARGSRAAIYKRLLGGFLSSYEAIKIVVKEPIKIAGKKYPAREAYPDAEDFGELAFFAKDKKTAEKYFKKFEKDA